MRRIYKYIQKAKELIYRNMMLLKKNCKKLEREKTNILKSIKTF